MGRKKRTTGAGLRCHKNVVIECNLKPRGSLLNEVGVGLLKERGSHLREPLTLRGQMWLGGCLNSADLWHLMIQLLTVGHCGEASMACAVSSFILLQVWGSCETTYLVMRYSLHKKPSTLSKSGPLFTVYIGKTLEHRVEGAATNNFNLNRICPEKKKTNSPLPNVQV